MRTNIDIDDTLMASAMRADPFSTKREAVEADLRFSRGKPPIATSSRCEVSCGGMTVPH